MALSSHPQAVAIRPIRPDDTDRLRAHHHRLSPESRYRRFLSTKPELSGADVRYLVEIDGCDHFALVATTGDGAEEQIVGVARYIRLPSDREVAEMAIVIDDDHQRQGLGTELVAQLARAAVARGVRRFQATLFPQNTGMRRLLQAIAVGPVDFRVLGGIAEMEVGLPGTPAAELPAAAGVADAEPDRGEPALATAA